MTRPLYVPVEPRPLAAGEERRHLRALPREDGDEAMVRASGLSWYVAIVGRPLRAGHYWLFTVETERLP